MSIEEAKQRAIRVLNIKEEQILNVIEKVKSKSFLPDLLLKKELMK